MAEFRAEKIRATEYRAVDRAFLEREPKVRVERLRTTDELGIRALDAYDTAKMERLHTLVSERAIAAPTPRHWYTKGAVELRLAHLTGDPWRVREAVTSFSRASRALSQAPKDYRLSAEGERHNANIAELLGLAYAFHGKR